MALILSGTDGLSDVDGSAATPAIRGTDANTGIFFPAADTIAFTEGGAEAMRIDSSGNVGIGTSSPAVKLHVTNSAGELARFNGSSSGTQYALITNNNSTTEGLKLAYTNTDGSTAIGSVYAAHLAFLTENTERARIDSSGNLLVGTTSSSFGEKLSVQSTASGTNIAYLNYTYTDDRSNTVIQHSRATGATSATMILFRNASSSQVGLISSTGSATTYTTSSDYRLKENIAPMTGALATVTKLNPVTYTWKDGGFSGQGFIAHELQAVVPDAVVGEKDAVDAEGNPRYQGIDTSFLVATLTAAIQELKALVDTQASTITALQADVEALKAPQGTP